MEMTEWLPKEILDYLEHAGYIAVPKESVQVAEAKIVSEQWELVARRENLVRVNEAIQGQIAHLIAIEMLRRGFIDIELSLVSDDYIVEHKGKVTVLKPRTIKPPTSNILDLKTRGEI
jgi:hypothetical protein